MLTFGTLVKITVGFYIGCTGFISNYLDFYDPPRYNLRSIRCTTNTNETIELHEILQNYKLEELEVIKKR